MGSFFNGPLELLSSTSDASRLTPHASSRLLFLLYSFSEGGGSEEAPMRRLQGRVQAAKGSFGQPLERTERLQVQ